MTRINGKTKGANGERELAKWLKENLQLNVLPTRNLEQVRGGGSDIIDVYPFYFECKRVEVLDLQGWWIQLKYSIAANEPDAEPVVAFRRNHKQWEFLISAKHVGLEIGYIRLTQAVFIEWANKKLDTYK